MGNWTIRGVGQAIGIIVFVIGVLGLLIISC